MAGSVKERLGVAVQAVSEKEAERYRMETPQGVSIAWVDPKGPLGDVGLEVRDLILEVNGQSVEGVEGFVSIVSSLPPQARIAILALDHRTGNTGYVRVAIR
jgi:S1-C subfamily serine protease